MEGPDHVETFRSRHLVPCFASFRARLRGITFGAADADLRHSRFFDAKRITAVTSLPPVNEFSVNAQTFSLSPQIFFPTSAQIESTAPRAPVTQVLGVFANLMAVKESIDDVLKLAGRDQFAEFTLMDGSKVWMRAFAIGCVSHQFPAAEVPDAGSFVGLGLAPGPATALKEDVDAVRKAIEQITPN
ncbi:hypothetical protein ACE103_09510 [Bradyrhizobium sp. ma5]|uniref:hypothetical protein n=1 Tax=Bradyrhizobium sp. ma5 TaxID=3344828 RepID=UPI0035D4B4EA